MKKSVAFLLIFCACTLIVQAQDYIDLAKIYYANTPLNQFDSTTQGTRVEELGVDFTLPVRLNENTALLSGFFFEKISTKTSPITALNSVYTANVRLGINLQHGDKWSGTYLLLPKLSSDFKNISAKDFQMGALVLLKYAKQEHLSYKMGLYYNSELFGPFFVPILGLYYKSPNNRFEANLTLPLDADINYALKPRFNVGLNFNAFVRSFYLSDPQFIENEEYLVKRTSEIFAYLQFNIMKSLLVQTRIGYSVGRTYRVYEENDKISLGLTAFKFGDDRKQLNTDFKDGAILNVRLVYRFFIPQ